MDKAQLIALYDQDQRINVEYPDSRREVTPDVVRHIDTSDLRQGHVIYSQLSEANADEIIREQISYFEGLVQKFEWKLFEHDRPSDLKERLVAHGFTVEEAEAIMVLDLAEASAVLWKAVTQDIQRITDPAKLADVLTVQQQVWDEDFSWLGEYLGGALTRFPDQMSVYVAYVDQQPASAAWTYFPRHSQFASLWGGSTVSGYRGQGLYTALLAVRTQEAKERGRAFLTVDASDMSRPILEKFGFQQIAWSWPCKWNGKTQE
ncbi:MAG TPA: GNAT family N-acetyltransferase [Anaerolineales bacterium]|nr:GNAT family N-acetyltransferase [Anaerolineales bacterium]